MTAAGDTSWSGLRRYAALWRLPGAPILIVAGLVARLPIGMGPLAIVLLIERSTGAYAYAGAASAAYALSTAVGGPVLGRLADRRGPAPVLVAAALGYPIGVAAVLGAVWGRAPFWAVLVACGVLGVCMPPLTATLRGVWADLTAPPRQHLNAIALAAETTIFEVVFVVGPMLVGLATAVASPAAALVVAAALTFGGTLTVAFGRATRNARPHPDARHTRGIGPLAAPGLPMLLLVTSGVTFAFGVVGVSVPAFADLHASPQDVGTVAGILLGLWGIGSVTGGVWFGTRTFRTPLPTQWAIALACAATGMAALALARSVPLLGLALLVGGCALAPALTVENALVARIAPPGMINEAYTWLVAVAVASGAAGSAVAGVIVDQPGGVPWAFALAAATTALGALASALPRSPLRVAGRDVARSHGHSGQMSSR